MEHFDVIVLGIGGVGSAVLDQLAQRGVKALGIDRFHPPHNLGSTHGQTRVIRQAYFEHPSYVPLLAESYRLWRSLEQRSGRDLFHEVGLLEVGPANGTVVPGVLRAAAEHGLAVESLSPREIMKRWPGLAIQDDLTGVFEPAAGYLLVEDCVAAHLSTAVAAGATILTDTRVHNWKAVDREIRVQTDRAEIVAERLVITAGPWAAQMLADLNLPLTVRRQSLFWFATASDDYNVGGGFPVFLFEMPGEQLQDRGALNAHGVFYGFPKLDSRGVKVAEHGGGAIVNDPMLVDRSIDLCEQHRLAKFLGSSLPGVSEQVTDHAVCLYTMSLDENFIVDRHPAHANVVFAAGLSGHGFKFAPVLGVALADLVMDGRTRLPIDFLSLARLQNK